MYLNAGTVSKGLLSHTLLNLNSRCKFDVALAHTDSFNASTVDFLSSFGRESI